ncbi:Bug family tripartite tricarboxylate transporter substrate binding protein [Roseovarius rhodophyticola]|uniref:Tripartite tricarboxylate transporter substrate binding protein n=1 Tax=Roseovarius rhodophyticola TaxID=3080827 RepID=A0ABZ2TH32_9RHOB|nr:tripartite tricarboxylate transporter substrate binding protein [Roseovarius sp. W115]MDV2931140.1 tripartite tricarboxylate transporter substrate binding protein [Roseovarius sp. W115]
MTLLKTLTASAAALALTAPAALAEWQPRKPVEFIIMAGTGGGADQIARLLQGLIEKKDLSPRPFIPINKPGGSGAEALRYMQDKAGDNHTVMMTLNSFYTTPIIQEDLGVDVTQFTPIGLMAMDTFLLWVNTDREDITDLDSYVETVKAAGLDWKVGGTGSGQEDSVLTAMMEAAFEYDVTYIPFPGGGTVAKNLVGNQIDSTVNNPSEQMEFFRAGNSKPLVQFTGERMAAFPDTPTAKELGVDIEYYMQRSVNGPPGMDPEAVEWYTNLFQELFDSQEWQDFCTSDGLTCEAMMKGDDLANFHATQKDAHVKLIEQVGADAITGE